MFSILPSRKQSEVIRNGLKQCSENKRRSESSRCKCTLLVRYPPFKKFGQIPKAPFIEVSVIWPPNHCVMTWNKQNVEAHVGGPEEEADGALRSLNELLSYERLPLQF